jgi:hypothetical protein
MKGDHASRHISCSFVASHETSSFTATAILVHGRVTATRPSV